MGADDVLCGFDLCHGALEGGLVHALGFGDVVADAAIIAEAPPELEGLRERAVAWTLASGMGAIQSRLAGRERILGYAAFHIDIRSGLAVAAVGAGAAGEFVGAVHWPLFGRLEPTRLVLFCSGIVVALSALWVRESSASPAAKPPAPEGPIADADAPPKGARCQSQW